MRKHHHGWATHPPHGVDVVFVVDFTMVDELFLDDVDGTKPFNVRAFVSDGRPGFASIQGAVKWNGIGDIGEIIRTNRTCESTQAVQKCNTAEKCTFLFPLFFPALTTIAGVVDAAVPIDVPAQIGRDKTDVVLFARIRLGVEFLPL